MEKIRTFFDNLSLRKSMACCIIVFAALALLLGGVTSGVCDRAARNINDKYCSEKEWYYLTNEAGERLGEGTYIWKGIDQMTEADERKIKILDVLPMIMYPVYSALCVALASILFYKRKLKCPLELLTDAASKISDNELDFSVNYQSKDEMGKLCTSFEVMRSALEKSQTEMWRAMDERKRLNAAFAHDLRTPLTVLKGYNEMIQLTGGQEEKKTADIMAKHILRMQNYVESMSSIRRLEDREPSMENVDLKEFCAVLEDAASVYCGEKGKTLVFEGRMVSEKMRLDAEFVLQVFHNLLSNAARYAKDCVTVQVEEENGIRITVLDNGQGFSERCLQNAAEPYYRGEKGKTEAGQEEHFGLGLYICKILCRSHGGCLKVENASSGGKVTAFFAAGESDEA